MIYLFIFEDGIIGKSTIKPSKIDYECQKQGFLQIIRCTGEVEFDSEDNTKAEPILESIYDTGGQYHINP